MRWEERGGDVWLLVEPTDDLRLEDVVRECDAAGYVEMDVDAVDRVLTTRGPEAVARVDPRRRAGSVEVVVDDAGATATLAVSPAGELAAPLSPDDVEAALARAGVRLGVDHLLLHNLPLHVPGEYLIATGWAPAAGRDGKVEYFVEPHHEFRPGPRDDGGVDFHAVATIPDVQEGQLLAALVDPTPGTPGRTVRGEVVPAEPGIAAVLPTGENVTVSEDGRRMYAATNGLLEIRAGCLSVRPEYVIDGDVDHQTGSISFSGDVIVRGSVRPGFKVRAAGQVVVMGDVEEAEVRGETLVWVRGAVVGARCLVHSAGDVKVRTVHHGRIEARRNLYVEREAHEATLLAGMDLVLERHRNRISGGAAWAGNQVLAGEIGAVGRVTTRVNAGVDPFTAELLERLAAEAAEHRTSLDRVEIAVAPFVEDADAVAALPPERRRAVDKLVAVAGSLRAQLTDLEQRVAQLRPEEDESRPRIAARMAIRPGVVLGIRGVLRTVQTTQHRVSATLVDGVVTLSPFGCEPLPSAPVRAAAR